MANIKPNVEEEIYIPFSMLDNAQMKEWLSLPAEEVVLLGKALIEYIEQTSVVFNVPDEVEVDIDNLSNKAKRIFHNIRNGIDKGYEKKRDDYRRTHKATEERMKKRSAEKAEETEPQKPAISAHKQAFSEEQEYIINAVEKAIQPLSDDEKNGICDLLDEYGKSKILVILSRCDGQPKSSPINYLRSCLMNEMNHDSQRRTKAPAKHINPYAEMAMQCESIEEQVKKYDPDGNANSWLLNLNENGELDKV